MEDEAIESTNDGIIGVKPIYQDAYMDTFREMMKEVSAKAQLEFQEGRIVGKEYSTVYLGAVQYAMATAAQLSKDEAEVRFKVENTLGLDLQIKREQVKQLQAETYFKNIQAEQIIQSVYDNRLIKIIDSLSDMVGMILNGGTQSVPASLLDTLVSVVNVVKVIPKLNYPMVMIDSPIDVWDVSVVDGANVYTAKTTVLISGSVRDIAVGETVHVQINGTVHTATVDNDLMWSLNINGSSLEADVDKTILASVSAADSLGNVKTSLDIVSYAEKPNA